MQIWLKSTSLPTESTKGSRTATTTQPHARDDTRRRRWSRPGPHGGDRAVRPGAAVSGPRPLAQRPTRTKSTTITTMKMISCCLAGDVTFHSRTRGGRPPDPGDEGDGQVDHGADERSRQRVEEQVRRERLSEGAGLVRRVEDRGEGREGPGHRPGQRRGAPDPDAERRAESAFSDMARIERPQEVKRTARTSATVTIGATMRVAPRSG